jgi:hypothetical protein
MDNFDNSLEIPKSIFISISYIIKFQNYQLKKVIEKNIN